MPTRMKVGIFGFVYTSGHYKELVFLLSSLSEFGQFDIFLEAAYAKTIPIEITRNCAVFSNTNELGSLDVLISIGGDGTILRAVSIVQDTGVPIMGINVGRLGFLATVGRENLSTLTKKLIERDYTIKSRSLLCVKTPKIDIPFALNEVAVIRKNTASMVTIETFLNGEPLASYWADGLIISTPTGSTGYSLSCGGPVMHPETSSFVITPIAPHNLNARPLVISDTTKVLLKVNGRGNKHLISMDTRTYNLKNDTEILVEKAPFYANFIVFKEDSFLETLRHKLLWAADRRN